MEDFEISFGLSSARQEQTLSKKCLKAIKSGEEQGQSEFERRRGKKSKGKKQNPQVPPSTKPRKSQKEPASHENPPAEKVNGGKRSSERKCDEKRREDKKVNDDKPQEKKSSLDRRAYGYPIIANPSTDEDSDVLEIGPPQSKLLRLRRPASTEKLKPQKKVQPSLQQKGRPKETEVLKQTMLSLEHLVKQWQIGLNKMLEHSLTILEQIQGVGHAVEGP